MGNYKFLACNEDGGSFTIMDMEGSDMSFLKKTYDTLEDTTKYKVEYSNDISTLGEFMDFFNCNFTNGKCHFGCIHIWCSDLGEVSPLAGWKYDNANPNLQHNIPKRYLDVIDISKDNIYHNEKTEHNGVYAYGSGNMLNLYFNLKEGHSKLKKESAVYLGQI